MLGIGRIFLGQVEINIKCSKQKMMRVENVKILRKVFGQQISSFIPVVKGNLLKLSYIILDTNLSVFLTLSRFSLTLAGESNILHNSIIASFQLPLCCYLSTS